MPRKPYQKAKCRWSSERLLAGMPSLRLRFMARFHGLLRFDTCCHQWALYTEFEDSGATILKYACYCTSMASRCVEVVAIRTVLRDIYRDVSCAHKSHGSRSSPSQARLRVRNQSPM